MEQLPGLACQHLMAQGYGYGGEGRLEGRRDDRHPKGHGRERQDRRAPPSWRITPTTSSRARSTAWARTCWRSARPWPPARPRIEVHSLGIGMTVEPPARLVFEGHAG